MNARLLEVFRAVMRNGTVTAAAETLRISQPAVSKALRTLEAELGYSLFDRLGGRLLPTPEAQLLIVDTDRIFRELEALEAYSERIRNNQIGLFRIAASAPPTFGLLPQALEQFRQRNPSIQISVMTLPAEEISERIAIGDIDLGITLEAFDQPGIQSRRIGRVEIHAIMPSKAQLSAKDIVRPRDLAGETLISYASNTLAGRLLDQAFESRGVKRNPTIEVTLSVTALPLLMQGLGIALVDDLVPWSQFPGLTTRRFSPTVPLEIVITTSTIRPRSRYIQEFTRDLRAAARR